MSEPEAEQMLTRWRLILGKDAEQHGVTMQGGAGREGEAEGLRAGGG
jgi:hypothetical protein